MSQSYNQTPQQGPPKNKGLIGRCFEKIHLIFAVLVCSLFLSIALEWIGIAFFWPDEGHLHSQKMMITEMQWLSDEFSRSLFAQSSVDVANDIISNVHDWLFVKTGIQSWLTSPGSGKWELLIYHYSRAYVESLIYITIVFVIRVLIIVFSCPLFVLAGIAGITEGLMLRDLRKFGAGRESAYVYHYARRYILPMMFTAWVIYLSVPFSLHPNLILLPFAIMFGLTICIAAATFKKFL